MRPGTRAVLFGNMGIGDAINNFQPGVSLSKFRAALLAGRPRVFFTGDSTTIGVNGLADKALGNPVQYAGALVGNGKTATGKNCIVGYSIGSGGVTDSRVVFGSGWAASLQALGSAVCFTNSTTTASLQFITPEAVDTCKIWYTTQGGQGTFTVNADGGSTLATINSGVAANFIGSAEISLGSLAQHTINIQRNGIGGAVHISCIECWDSTQAHQIRLINGAASGTASADLSSTLQAWSALNALGIFAPDLTFINVSINDENVPVDLATVYTNIQAIVTKAKLSGDAVVVVHNPRDPASGTSFSDQKRYADNIKQVAMDNNLPWIDLRVPFGRTYPAAVARGFMDTDNQTHPNDSGYKNAVAPTYADMLSRV